MKIEPLSLEYQPLLKEKFNQLNLNISEYSFANLYLFRRQHRYEVMHIHDEIFVKGLSRDGTTFIMPTSPLLKHTQEAAMHADYLFPIPDQWLTLLEKNLLQASIKDDDSDYIYQIEKLAFYPGRHLSNKRNLVKQLERQHKVDAMDIAAGQLPACSEVLDRWQDEQKGIDLETDYLACKEGIDKFYELDLHGRIIYIDDSPAGFIIGEQLNQDCYVVHFCKGLHSIKGLYQYLYQDLGKRIKDRVQWINLEQDLGLLALRDAKHSYLPDQLLRKWRVELRRI